MGEKEQKMLRSDAEANREQAAEMSPVKLRSAVRRGIGEGRVRARRRSIFYVSGGVLAFAAVLLLTFAALQPAGHMADVPDVSVQRDWGAFEVFRERAEGDRALTRALDQGEVRPLEATVEKDGYTVTVHGAAADSQSMIVLYSVQNDSGEAAVIGEASVKYESPDSGMGSSSSGDRVLEVEKTSYQVVEVLLNGEAEYSTAAMLELVLTPDHDKARLSSSMEYRTEIEVPFEFDRSGLAAREHTTEGNEVLSIDGQRIYVPRVLTTPLGVYVDITYDPNNTKKIFGLIRPKLIVHKEGKTEELPWIGSTNETMQFMGASSTDPDWIELEIDGISALERNKLQLVVDTEKMTVIEAPDQGVELEPAGEEYASGFVVVKKTGPVPNGMSSGTQLGSTFKDGNGVEHKIGPSDGLVSHSMDGKEGEVTISREYLYIGDQKWPQPLTFDILRYPNPIMEKAKVRID